MKAVRYHAYGDSGVLVYEEADRPVAGAGERFNVVINLARTSPEETTALADLAADGGAFVSTTGPAPDPGRGVRAVQMSARSDSAQLAGLADRVDAGELRIGVAQRRPLADLAAVHDQAAAGELPGKTILIP